MENPQVAAHIAQLKDAFEDVRRNAVVALGQIGDSNTLPRKILAESRFSAPERINLLERLRRVRYNERGNALRYTFPETRELCQTVLNEKDTKAREGAQTVLYWLDVGQYLPRASQPDTINQPHELLRAYEGDTPEARFDTLLRATDEPEKDVQPAHIRPTLRQRLFGKRK